MATQTTQDAHGRSRESKLETPRNIVIVTGESQTVPLVTSPYYYDGRDVRDKLTWTLSTV